MSDGIGLSDLRSGVGVVSIGVFNKDLIDSFWFLLKKVLLSKLDFKFYKLK